MIYLVGSLSGFVNGFFTCGAGQIIIFYLVFIKNKDTHISRGTSIAVLSMTSIVSLIAYLFLNKIEISKIVIVAILSLICGFFGSKIMKKINSKWLNLISGILMTVLAIISIFNR